MTRTRQKSKKPGGGAASNRQAQRNKRKGGGCGGGGGGGGGGGHQYYHQRPPAQHYPLPGADPGKKKKRKQWKQQRGDGGGHGGPPGGRQGWVPGLPPMSHHHHPQRFQPPGRYCMDHKRRRDERDPYLRPAGAQRLRKAEKRSAAAMLRAVSPALPKEPPRAWSGVDSRLGPDPLLVGECPWLRPDQRLGQASAPPPPAAAAAAGAAAAAAAAAAVAPSLHEELLAFQRYVGLRPPEAEARAALVAEIERVVRQHCPGATVATFGSMTASLATFLSDVDLTVCDLSAPASAADAAGGDDGQEEEYVDDDDDDENEEEDSEADEDEEEEGSGDDDGGGKEGCEAEEESDGDDSGSEDSEEARGWVLDGVGFLDHDAAARPAAAAASAASAAAGEEQEEGEWQFAFNNFLQQGKQQVGFVIGGDVMAAAGATATPKETQKRELHLLYPKLLSGCPHVVESEFRPRARVPIIYMQHANGVEVDIRCDRPDTAAVTFLRRLVASHPAFIPVATLLKLLLHQGGMDKPFEGGLGSFKLYILLGRYLKYAYRGPEQDAGAVLQGFLRHYGLEQPLSKRTKSVRFEEWTVDFVPPFKHEALRCLFMRSYQALEDAHNDNGGRHRRFREGGAASPLVSKLSTVIDGVELARLRDRVLAGITHPWPAPDAVPHLLHTLQQRFHAHFQRQQTDPNNTNTPPPHYHRLFLGGFPAAAKALKLFVLHHPDPAAWRVPALRPPQQAPPSLRAGGEGGGGGGGGGVAVVSSTKRLAKRERKRAKKEAVAAAVAAGEVGDRVIDLTAADGGVVEVDSDLEVVGVRPAAAAAAAAAAPAGATAPNNGNANNGKRGRQKQQQEQKQQQQPQPPPPQPPRCNGNEAQPQEGEGGAAVGGKRRRGQWQEGEEVEEEGHEPTKQERKRAKRRRARERQRARKAEGLVGAVDGHHGGA